MHGLTNPRAPSTVEASDEEAFIEVQTLVLPLDNDVYEAFGLTHANRKRALEAASASILTTDLTYLQAETRLTPRTRRYFELHLARAAGSLRQDRHRAAMRLRSPPHPK